MSYYIIGIIVVILIIAIIIIIVYYVESNDKSIKTINITSSTYTMKVEIGVHYEIKTSVDTDILLTPASHDAGFKFSIENMSAKNVTLGFTKANTVLTKGQATNVSFLVTGIQGTAIAS